MQTKHPFDFIDALELTEKQKTDGSHIMLTDKQEEEVRQMTARERGKWLLKELDAQKGSK